MNYLQIVYFYEIFVIMTLDLKCQMKTAQSLSQVYYVMQFHGR